jgi:hypothetical protein
MFIVDRKQQIPTLPAAKAVSSGQATMMPLYASRTNAPVTELRVMFDPGLFANPTALTLTMKKRAGGRNADHIIASTNFRHFINRLSHALLGARAKRYGNRLKTFAVIERNADGRLHYHAMIDRPDHCSLDEFRAVTTDQWQRTEFGYRHIDIKGEADAGWADYMLKFRQKASLLDAIDWTNCH